MKIDGSFDLFETIKHKIDTYWDGVLFGNGGVLLKLFLGGWMFEMWNIIWHAALGTLTGIIIKYLVTRLWRYLKRKLKKHKNREKQNDENHQV